MFLRDVTTCHKVIQLKMQILLSRSRVWLDCFSGELPRDVAVAGPQTSNRRRKSCTYLISREVVFLPSNCSMCRQGLTFSWTYQTLNWMPYPETIFSKYLVSLTRTHRKKTKNKNWPQILNIYEIKQGLGQWETGRTNHLYPSQTQTSWSLVL